MQVRYMQYMPNMQKYAHICKETHLHQCAQICKTKYVFLNMHKHLFYMHFIFVICMSMHNEKYKKP